MKRKIQEYEEHLNRHYSENVSFDEAVEALDYLTVKSRGQHCSLPSLKNHILKGTAGTLIRQLDPIGFNVGMEDFNR